jgi:hypothetical protein
VRVPKPPSLWRAVGWLIGGLLVAKVSTMELPPTTRSNAILIILMVVFFAYVTTLLLEDRGEP